MRRRKAAAFIHAIAIVVCMLAVSGAGANVIPSVTTSFTQDQVIPTGNTGATTLVTNPASKLGQHGDFNLNLAFGYGATGTMPVNVNGSSSNVIQVEDPATYPAGSDDAESVANLVVDLPAGLVGNPNSIPFEERCELSTFETGTCPDSSVIGSLTIGITLVGQSITEDPDNWIQPQVGDSYLNFKIGPATKANAGRTRVALLKTDPEVPAKIGIMVVPPTVSNAHNTHDTITIEPDTNGDLRLRSVVKNVSNWLYSKSDETHSGNFRIDTMNLKFFGKLPNGNSFMTNPTSCQDWTTSVWANAKYINTNLVTNPIGGAPAYTAPATSTAAPDCSNSASVPFPAKGAVTISSPDRDTSPAFDFVIDNPGIYSLDDNVSTSPKKIVTTIPASLNVDVQQLGRVCQLPAFQSDNCPTTSRVGSVKIETPLIRAGLTGDVYLVKRNAQSGLPDLGLRVRGAITFTQLGSNRYSGPKNNQIETTFDQIPQVGFSKLSFHLDGGANGLLRSLRCPTYNKAPALPNFTYNFTAWTGATTSSATPLNMKNCFGIQQLKKYPKCLHKKLPIHPNYQSRSRLKNVSLKLDKKRKGLATKRPFRFDVPIKKLRHGKHSFELTATYDDGTVSKKTASFRVCKK